MRNLESRARARKFCAAMLVLVASLVIMPTNSGAAIVAGRTSATFAVANSGAASYAIPLWSPPGVGDVQLDLALVYNSRSPNGVLGIGWSLAGLSAITRCNRTWAQDVAPQRITLTLSDRFCLDGQQLKLVSGIYGQNGSTYATEIESFSKIEAKDTAGNGPASFTVTTKNGLIYEYGLTPDSQIKPGGGSTIKIWALSKIRDRVLPNDGNRINFYYTNDTANGTYRLASIAYPTTATNQGPFYEVLFTYAARPTNDIPSSYSAGFLSREPNRLTTITVRNYGSPTPTKRYDLLYGQGTATNRSRLTSVQECSATNCLPATSIAYQNGTTGWSSTLQSTGVTTSTASGVNPIPVDLNADGLTDILYPKVATSTTSRWWAILANVSGFGTAIDTGITTANAALEIVGAFSGTGQQQVLMSLGGFWSIVKYNPGGYFTATSTNVPVGGEYAAVDYDGDGLPDLATVVGNNIQVRRNTTAPPGPVTFDATAQTVFTYTGTWTISAGGASRMTMADFDGDGRADLHFTTYTVVILHGEEEYFYRAEILRSNGFGTPAAYTQISGADSQAVAGDWNADGCTDIIEAPGKVYISNCAGGFTSFYPFVGAGAHMVGDWDGDGRTDALAVGANNTWYVLRSTGEGYLPTESTGTAAPPGTQWFVFDQDGDGLLDAGFVDTTAGNAIKYRLHNGATIPADLATSFTDGYGINQSPSYKTISRNNYTKHADAAFPEQDFQGPLYVVDQFTASDGIGGTFQNQFWYYGARFHAQGRGFEGFYGRRAFDTRSGLYGYDYSGRLFPHTGMLIQRALYQNNGTTPISTWSAVPASQTSGGAGFEQRVFPFIASSTQTNHEFGGSLNGAVIDETVTQYIYGDGYGNPTNVVTSITDKDPYSPFFNSQWQTTVVKTFENNASLNCFGLPQTADITSAVPGQTTQTRRYSYANDINLCRVRQEVIEPNIPALKVTTTLGFDSCGNLGSVQVTGSNPNGTAMSPRTTLIGFGTRCQLPESLTNALNQTSNFGYRYDFGLLTQLSDPNGITTLLEYEDFGRLSREDRPDGTATVSTYDRCATPPCWGAADLRLRITEDLRSTSNASFNTRQLFYDGLDRIRSHETNRVLGVWTKNVVEYDALSRIAKVHQPYSSSSNGWQARAYDPIGRILTAKLYQGNGTLDRTINYGYAGRTISITDPLLRTTQQVRDVRNQLRRVIDQVPAGGTTKYDYDVFGNLNRIEDPIGAISSGTYNLRGFKTQWEDIDQGTWNLTPNSLNELVSWTDAKLQNFSAIYDPLGRMTSRTEPVNQVSTWVWGALATENNIGALKSKSGYNYTEAYTYDNSGRLSNRKITSDQVYNYDYTYNSIGALNTIKYPTSPIPTGKTVGRFRVQYSYDKGEPYRIQDVTEPTAVTLWQLTTANDYSSPTAETLGAGLVSVTSGYKAWTNELTSMTSGVSPSTTNRQNLSYEWDTVGNLTKRQDLIQNLTEVFTPDELNRVKSSTLNGGPNLDMGYNAAGNILSKTGVSGTYNYGPTTQPGCTYYAHSQPHAVRNAGGVVYCYDQNGNVVKRGGLTQTWASFNLPTTLQATVNGSTYQSQFSYGPDHQRWKQIGTYSNGTETTHYVGDLLEKVASTYTSLTYWRHYVPTPTGLTVIVSRNSNNSTWTTYAMSDHLGSSDALLNGAGNYAARLSFEAFGARRGSDWKTSTPPEWPGIADTTRRGFTFHEMLDNIGLIHMNGRVYDPVVGRFMSVDPIIGNLSDSQSANPFAYVGNRPLSFVDPTGHSANDITVKVVIDVIAWARIIIGGHGPPPPPPASAWPGTSAQNSVSMCDAGMRSTMCAGVPVMSVGQVPSSDGGAIPGQPQTTSSTVGGTQIGSFLKQLAIGTLDSLLEGEWYSSRIDATGRLHPSLAEEFGQYESPFAQPVTSEDEFARDLGPAAAVLVGVIARSPAGAARGVLQTPRVASGKLQNIINDLYRGTTNPNRIGNGTTMDAIRHEVATGQRVGGVFHSQKGTDYARGLENWLRANPNAPYRDRVVAQSILDDLRSAMGGSP